MPVLTTSYNTFQLPEQPFRLCVEISVDLVRFINPPSLPTATSFEPTDSISSVCRRLRTVTGCAFEEHL